MIYENITSHMGIISSKKDQKIGSGMSRLQKLTQNVQVNSLALLADCQSFVGRLLVDSQPTDGQQIFWELQLVLIICHQIVSQTNFMILT